MSDRDKPAALTMGEPAGIGGELSLKAWLGREASGVPPFFTIDDPARLEQLAKRLDWTVPVTAIDDPEDAPAAFSAALPVLPHAIPGSTVPGQPDDRNANAVLGAIRKAAELALAGRIAAVVTNPIHKMTLYQAGFRYPGHTEFLAELAGVDRSVMMLICPGLRVVPVTTHISLVEAVGALDRDEIVTVSRITAQALQRDFGVAEPHLMMAALNPHAGEGGSIGIEEKNVIAPAVAALKKMGISVSGPAPADTLFHERARAGYDAVICMHHDQALIPLKTIDFHGGVNVTLGLPFVRTSPDHGTAFEIAGMGVADVSSLNAALRAAHDISHCRRAWRARDRKAIA